MIQYLPRRLDIKSLSKKKSIFLFGPRSTGKSRLLKHDFPESQYLNLLDSELYLNLSQQPQLLESYLNKKKPGPLIIDEVQRIPDLLNEVHRLIEDSGKKFILTGSSARKLKRGQANLLAGRAWTANLFPFAWPELNHFDLEKYLFFGGLPNVALSEDPAEEMKAYVDTYLREEVQAEGLVRKIPDFNRFLRVAALSTAQILNFEKIAREAQAKPSTVKSYFEILEDTMIGFHIPAWTNGKLRRTIRAPKFFMFDCGVVRHLGGIKSLDPASDLFGRSFEQFIAQELRVAISYSRKDRSISYWRSAHGHEVDFVINDDIAIEVKATTKPNSDDLSGLKNIAEEGSFKHRILVCRCSRVQTIQGIEILPYSVFLEKLWSDLI